MTVLLSNSYEQCRAGACSRPTMACTFIVGNNNFPPNHVVKKKYP